MPTPTALLRMQFGMVGLESTSSTQEAEKTKSASLPAYSPQTTKLEQKSWKQQQPTLKSTLMLFTVLSFSQMPCPSCRLFSPIGTLTTTTYLPCPSCRLFSPIGTLTTTTYLPCPSCRPFSPIRTLTTTTYLPCPSCRPFSPIETLTTTTYLLLLSPSAEVMQSPCSGFPPTATFLVMRLLTLWQRRA